MKKLMPLLVVGFFIISMFGASGLQLDENMDEKNESMSNYEQINIQYQTSYITDTISVSEAEIIPKGEYVLVEFEEATSMLMDSGKPMIPVVAKTFTVPAGSRVVDTEVTIDWDEITLSKEIQPAPLAEPMSLDIVKFDYERVEFDNTIYNSGELYPSEPYTVDTGVGLDDGEHVLFINVRCNAQYSPSNNYINVPDSIDISITYEEPETSPFSSDVYDFLIITHDKFEAKLQDLVNHRNSQGINTKMVTVDDIYPQYDGVDDWEDIKLYLADKVKEWGVDYVLLAGGRKGQTHEWYVPAFSSNNFDGAYADDEETIPYDMTYASDLYYADVYYADQYGYLKMDDWDSNDNGVYAEGPYYEDFDIPDYYPDVHLGRIPLRYSWEADIVVDKIIEYDNNVNPSWFEKCVLCGGDTSPPARGDVTEGIYEGELACDVTGDHLSSIGFDVTKLYTSTNGDQVIREPDDVTPVISQGCGWVNMQTHSNPAVCGNFHPDGPTEDDFSYFYTIFDVRNFNNDGEYPFFVIDGCHSGQFNVALQQAIDAGGLDYPRAGLLEFTPTDISSWALLQDGGGSIGTIGVSGLGYGYINEGITQGLGGWIMPRFAHAFAIQGKERTGEIWTQGITDYINIIGNINSDEIDRKTIEERVMFGDPTVRLGGGMQSPPMGGEDEYLPEDDGDNPLTTSNVPTWETGQEWTYDIYDFDFSFHEVPGRDADIQINAGTMNLRVDDVSGDSYTLAFEIDSIEGSFDIYFDPYTGEEPTEFEFEFPPGTAVTGNIYKEKNTLATTKVEATIDLGFDTQQLLDDFGINLPSLLVRILLPETIPVTADLQLDFDDPYTILQFPLAVDNEWGIEAGTITIDGTITSRYFVILNFLNNLVKTLFKIDLLPPEFAKYLPEIDISEFLADSDIPNEFEIAEMNEFFRKSPYEVERMEDVTVGAGSFNSYNIEVIQGAAEIFYSPDAENIVKIEGNLKDFVPIAEDIKMELIDYK